MAKRNPQKIATAYRSAYNRLPEPVCAIYEPKGKSRLLQFYKQGISCPRKILINSNVQLLDPLDKRWLDNVNNPFEYRSAIKLLKKRRRA